jgi:hypothetical protein
MSLPEGEAITEEFLSTALGKDGSQYKSYWAKLVFTGKGTPPEIMSNNASMVSAISSNTSGIGFVASGTNVDGVKVVGTY